MAWKCLSFYARHRQQPMSVLKEMAKRQKNIVKTKILFGINVLTHRFLMSDVCEALLGLELPVDDKLELPFKSRSRAMKSANDDEVTSDESDGVIERLTNQRRARF